MVSSRNLQVRGCDRFLSPRLSDPLRAQEFLHPGQLWIVGVHAWLLYEPEERDDAQCKVSSGRGNARVSEKEETMAAERNEVDGRMRWQAEGCSTGAGKDYCACRGKESCPLRQEAPRLRS